MVAKVGTLLGGNDTTHQLHGRIILAAIAVALAFHGNSFQLMSIGLEADNHLGREIGIHFYAPVFIADSREREFPAFVTFNRKASGMVGSH